jgi:quinol monooxygenase YgiN
MTAGRSAQITRLHALPGKAGQMLAVLEGFLAASNGEPDTYIYAIHRDLHEQDVFWVYELFSSDEARVAHAQAPEVERLIESLGPLRAEASWIHPLVPLSAKIPAGIAEP